MLAILGILTRKSRKKVANAMSTNSEQKYTFLSTYTNYCSLIRYCHVYCSVIAADCCSTSRFYCYLCIKLYLTYEKLVESLFTFVISLNHFRFFISQLVQFG